MRRRLALVLLLTACAGPPDRPAPSPLDAPRTGPQRITVDVDDVELEDVLALLRQSDRAGPVDVRAGDRHVHVQLATEAIACPRCGPDAEEPFPADLAEWARWYTRRTGVNVLFEGEPPQEMVWIGVATLRRR